MNDEKIVITQDECDTATPMTLEPAWSASASAPTEPSETRSPWKGIALAVIITAFAFVVLGMAAYCVLWTGTGSGIIGGTLAKTVDQYRTECVSQMNGQLADPNNATRKYIESAHLTVTVTKAYVMHCEVTTCDGSQLAGRNDSNIREVDCTIRFFWKGIFDEGHSDLKIAYDKQAGEVLSAKIVDTTALINITDPDFWVGFGALLFL